MFVWKSSSVTVVNANADDGREVRVKTGESMKNEFTLVDEEAHVKD